jgi:hypothetical protein
MEWKRHQHTFVLTLEELDGAIAYILAVYLAQRLCKVCRVSETYKTISFALFSAGIANDLHIAWSATM